MEAPHGPAGHLARRGRSGLARVGRLERALGAGRRPEPARVGPPEDEGHADHRGTAAFNQALTERRVARVKSFLVEQGVPEAVIDTKAFGAERNLTTEQVKESIQHNTELSNEERKRALSRIEVIRMASNRRVDVTLNAGGATETSVRQFPFNAADALTLIGGREGQVKKPMTRRAPKKPVKKP